MLDQNIMIRKYKVLDSKLSLSDGWEIIVYFWSIKIYENFDDYFLKRNIYSSM